jgi:hypothetical protein
VVKSLLLGLGMLVFGVALAFGGGRAVYRSYSSQRWPTADAKITRSSVDKQRARRSVSFMPHVGYDYSVGGKSYSSETLAFGAGVTAGDLDDANEYVHQYPVGAAVKVHYSPDDPTVVCLDCGKVGIADYIITAAGAALLVLAILGLFETYRSELRARERAQGKGPVRKARAERT